MTSDPELSKPVAHALLDLFTAYDDDATDAQNQRAVETAFSRLQVVDAVSATYDDETDTTTVNITPLLSAWGYIGNLLLDALAEELGIDRAAMIAIVRERVVEH